MLCEFVNCSMMMVCGWWWKNDGENRDDCKIDRNDDGAQEWLMVRKSCIFLYTFPAWLEFTAAAVLVVLPDVYHNPALEHSHRHITLVGDLHGSMVHTHTHTHTRAYTPCSIPTMRHNCLWICLSRYKQPMATSTQLPINTEQYCINNSTLPFLATRISRVLTHPLVHLCC